MIKWCLKVAWRDARRQRARLLLCSSAIVFGVAAVVALQSFGHNLKETVEMRAQALLGADLEIRSRLPFSPAAGEWMAGLSSTRSSEVRFSSMVTLPRSGDSRLVQVRGLAGDFPYYGELETLPTALRPRSGVAEALVEESLMRQYEVEVGDEIQLGHKRFTIIGALLRIPGEAGVAGVFAPRVLVPLDQIEDTGLVQYGSIAFYRCYILFDEESAWQGEEAYADFLAAERLRVETVESRKRQLGDALDGFQRYLSLSALVALLLGGVGVAGAAHAYLSEKRGTVAILRCLGASARLAAGVFALQMAIVAAVAALAGAALGALVQQTVPLVMEFFLPFEVATFLSLRSIFSGVLLGWLTVCLFSLLALKPLLRVPPLAALRVTAVGEGGRLSPGLIAILVLVAYGYAVAIVGEWDVAAWFTAGLATLLGLLLGLAWTLRWLLRRVVWERSSFEVRQAVSSLYRPQNRTLFLIATLGFGTALIYSLSVVEGFLLAGADWQDHETTPNLMIWDIQDDERDGVLEILQAADLPVKGDAPVVTMRLQSINGKGVAAILQDPDNEVDDWVLTREYRSSYRSALIDGEELVDGELVSKWTMDRGTVPVSVEVGYAESLGVGIGDRMTFDVLGLPIEVEVASLREVDWRQLRPNFFILFPPGILEQAPSFHIVATRVPDRDSLAAVQRTLIEAFPTIATIDLTLILDTLTSLLDRARLAVRFVASFTLFTGMVVMISAVVASRYQRTREIVLLRTLGAGRSTIRRILLIEFSIVGLLSGLAGVLLGSVAAYVLALFYFNTEFTMPWLGASAVIVCVTALAVAAGMLAAAGLTRVAPLEILRRED